MTKEQVIARFWRFVRKTEQCWEWIGERTTTGYGNFRYGHSSRMKAHRFSYLLHKGGLSELFVCHTCNNTLCVNPAHLYAGTAKDNVRDMIVSRNQNNQKKTHCSRGHEYSEENTYQHKNGSRRCRKCYSEYYFGRKYSKLAEKSICEVPIWKK
jgi:hypothetical protein